MAVSTTTPLQITIAATSGSTASNTQAPSFWSSQTPSFKDVIDTINPLQHIPVVSSIYHYVTGDTESTGAKLAGGALFGGPIGFVASLFDSIVQSQTGHDTLGTIVAALQGEPMKPGTTASVQTAQAEDSAIPDHLSPNQRSAYNSYVHTQKLLG